MTYWSPIKLSDLCFVPWDAGSTGTWGRSPEKDENLGDYSSKEKAEESNAHSKILCFKRCQFWRHFWKASAIPGHMIPIPGRAGTQGLPRGWSLGFPEQNTVQRGVIFHITFVQKGHTGDNCNRKKTIMSHRQSEGRAETQSWDVETNWVWYNTVWIFKSIYNSEINPSIDVWNHLGGSVKWVKISFFFFSFKQVLTGYYFTSNQTKNPECPTMFTDFKFEKYIQWW